MNGATTSDLVLLVPELILVGMALALIGNIEQAVTSVGDLVEGIPTAKAVGAMADKCKVEMPIASEVARVLSGDSTPQEAVRRLLARDPAAEGL